MGIIKIQMCQDFQKLTAILKDIALADKLLEEKKDLDHAQQLYISSTSSLLTMQRESASNEEFVQEVDSMVKSNLAKAERIRGLTSADPVPVGVYQSVKTAGAAIQTGYENSGA